MFFRGAFGKSWFVPNQFASFKFPLGPFVFRSHFFIKQARVHSLAGLSLCSYVTASYVLIAFFIVGQHQELRNKLFVDVLKKVCFSTLVWFVWTYVNTTMALWCGTKQASRHHLQEAVSAGNQRAVCLHWEHNRPSNQNEKPSYVLPGNRWQKMARQYGQNGPSCIAVFVQHCSTECSAPLFSF